MTAAGKQNQIAESWDQNADLWTRAVREQRIPSRRTVTDAAILNAVAECEPRLVLDMGCGEGWLTRALAARFGCSTVGVDGSARLVDQARQAHRGGTYLHHSYDEVTSGAALSTENFDAIVCNFSLLGDSLLGLVRALRERLSVQGTLIVQTTHPLMTVVDSAYVDGWRLENFETFEDDRWMPMPWYFRTLESWVELFRQSGLVLSQFKEPADPENCTPLSAIFVCVPA